MKISAAKRKREIDDLIGDEPAADTIAAELSASGLARFLDINHRTVNVLAGRGVLARLANGNFDTTDSVRRYLAFSRKGGDSDLDAAKLRKTEAEAEKAELANARLRGELLEASTVEREWASILRDLRAALLAVPSRIGSRLPALTPHDLHEIDAEIRSTLETLAGAPAVTGRADWEALI